eukprot:6175186-Pleurochrysis_carterae.AAC.2
MKRSRQNVNSTQARVRRKSAPHVRILHIQKQLATALSSTAFRNSTADTSSAQKWRSLDARPPLLLKFELHAARDRFLSARGCAVSAKDIQCTGA